jgi:uncharacterized membrane protein YbhN (UPF0104 family)
VIGLPAILVIAGHPHVLRLLSRPAEVLTGRAGPPAGRPLVAAAGIAGANMAIKSAAFLLFARALLPVHAGDTALLVGAVNLAVVAGMIGITPAGIGVREGVLAAVLGSRFGAADAAALALALRLWDLAVELPWVAAAVITGRRPAVAAPSAPTADGPE